MAGSGPISSNPEDAVALLAEAKTARETLAAIMVLHPVRRVPALRSALEKYPDDVGLLSTSVVLAQSSRSEADFVLSAARRWAATEPDNALPRLVVLEIPKQAEKDPAFVGTAEEFDRLLASVEDAMKSPNSDSHRRLRFLAGVEAKQRMGRPFWGLAGLSSEMGFPFLRTQHAISSGGQKFFDSGDTSRARRAAELLVRWGERDAAGTTRAVETVFADVKMAAGWRLMAKLDRAAGDEAKAAGWEEKINALKGRQREVIDPAVGGLFSLPVPALLNAIGSRLEENETAFHAFWNSLAKSPVEKKTPNPSMK
jgi:hypothetical protein